jgi:hypothetical protein
VARALAERPPALSAADLALEGEGTLVERFNPKTALTVLPTAAAPGRSHFDLRPCYACLADAFGRGNQEVLHALVPLATMKVPAPILAAARVRIVEVQFRRVDGDPPLPSTVAVFPR